MPSRMLGPLAAALLAATALVSGCGDGATSGSGLHPHGRGAVWPGESTEDVRAWLRSLPRAPRVEEVEALDGRSASVPDAFDARDAFVASDGSSLVMGALDQGDAEICWAYSAASVVADRLRIGAARAGLSNDLFQTVTYASWSSAAGSFSGPDVPVLDFPDPVQIVQCCASSVCSDLTASTACETEGMPEWAYDSLERSGAATFAGLPLQSCESACPATPAGAFVVRSGGPYVVLDWDHAWSSSSPRTLQTEVAAHGPVSVYMQVPPQFDDWFRTVGAPNGPITTADVFDSSDTGGEAYATRDTSLGGHFVVILGWGTTTDEPPLDYWIVRNSWGQAEADQGIFRIERGRNFCMIEQWAQAVPASGPR